MPEPIPAPEPIWAGAPRVCAGRPLPPYSYVPGATPHPTADPGGHGYGKEVPEEHLPPQLWRKDRSWLFGVDLYHAGYLFEAHVAWEGIWLAAIRGSAQDRFLRGLLLTAAAVLKGRAGDALATAKLVGRARGRLAAVLGSPSLPADGRFMGIDVARLLRRLEPFDPSAPPRLALSYRSSPD